MYRELMSGIFDALSSSWSKVSDYVSKKYASFMDWAELGRRKRKVKRKLSYRYNYVKDGAVLYGNAYGGYIVYEFLPNTLAHGILFNTPAAFFFGFALTPFSVISFGFTWYIVFILLPDAVQEAVPRISVKVDN